MISTDTAGPSPIINLDGVVLEQYDGSHVGPLNWTIHQSEHWAIVGPIGSGKALIAQAIAGRLPPQQGQISYTLPGSSRRQTVASHVIHRHIAYETFNRRPGIGATFHQARWHADLETASPTVADTLSATGIWKQNPYEVRTEAAPEETRSTFEDRCSHIFVLLEITPLLSRRLHQLSDGEWRRVQIARALLRAPQVLILDDPLTGLDQTFRKKLDPALSELTSKHGVQLVVLMSEGTEMLDTVTHVLKLNGTGIVAQGLKDDLPAQCTSGTAQDPNATEVHPPATEIQAPAVIHLQNIKVTHNGVQILQDLDWTVRQGEKWALVGPNGAGKSTLLSLILGDHPQAYANSITLFGRPRGSGESIWEIKRRIGWVSPELHRYHPSRTTTFDVICSGYFDSIGLHQQCSADQQAHATRWMTRMGLKSAAHEPFRLLPKGQQRLALITRALVKGPELLILDEPCQGLDGTHVADVLQALEEITLAPDRTLIYVTHRPSEFPRGLTHILELSAGKAVRQGILMP